MNCKWQISGPIYKAKGIFNARICSEIERAGKASAIKNINPEILIGDDKITRADFCLCQNAAIRVVKSEKGEGVYGAGLGGGGETQEQNKVLSLRF